MPIDKDSPNTDVGNLLTGIMAAGAAISAVVGALIAIFVKKGENDHLRANNAALRQVGDEAFNIIEYHPTLKLDMLTVKCTK
jgi:hypothetical protein